MSGGGKLIFVIFLKVVVGEMYKSTEFFTKVMHVGCIVLCEVGDTGTVGNQAS